MRQIPQECYFLLYFDCAREIRKENVIEKKTKITSNEMDLSE